MDKEVKDKVLAIAGKNMKIIFWLIWVCLAIYIVPMFFIGFLPDERSVSMIIPLCGVAGMFFLGCIFIYYSKMHPLNKSAKTLNNTGKITYLDEIVNKNYNTDGKICISEHLLYDKKTNIIVAFDDIVWIYKKKDRATTEIIFCTVDGKKHKSQINDATLNGFLNRRSGILLGYTPQNKILYEGKVAEFQTKMK